MLQVAAVQYCAGDNAKDTLAHLGREFATHAEWEDNSYSQSWLADQARQLGMWLLAGSLMIPAATTINYSIEA